MLDSIAAQFFIAFALGLDAFSVCLGIGLQQIRLKKIAVIGLWIGFFHIIMPLIGLLLGSLLFERVANVTEITSGLLLFGLGAYMIIHTFGEHYHYQQRQTTLNVMAIILLAFSVSIDSFPVGISLGMSGIEATLTLLMFGVITTTLTWLSLLIGKKVQRNIGRSFDWLGGVILCFLGLYIIF